MQSMEIYGGISLSGEVFIGGAKNLALPAMVLGLVTDEDVVLSNVPNLSDVRYMAELLSFLGAEISESKNGCMCIKTKELKSCNAQYDFVRKMRASILVLGPLLGRYGRAVVSLPGGCAIGARGVDLHIKALRELGAKIEIENGYIIAEAPNGLIGTDIVFDKVTVTGTENVIIASVFASGTTKIVNASVEPEVVSIAECLNSMGAKITGIGTSTLTIDGIKNLRGTSYKIIPDRIEAGTYACAASITGGKLLLRNCPYDKMLSFWRHLSESGCSIEKIDDDVFVSRCKDEIVPCDIQTASYPGFPTDLQAQFTALMTLSNGTSFITETIFENRFMHVPELRRLGANVSVVGKTAIVTGVNSLAGASVMATDLRASASLVLAGLSANGKTTINRLYHLNRGYENMDQKLSECGARVRRIDV